MATKKVAKVKKEKTEYDILVLELMNKSKDVIQSVLEVGDAMAGSCHEVDDVIHELCKLKGYERGDHWGDFE